MKRDSRGRFLPVDGYEYINTKKRVNVRPGMIAKIRLHHGHRPLYGLLLKGRAGADGEAITPFLINGEDAGTSDTGYCFGNIEFYETIEDAVHGRNQLFKEDQ